MHITFSLRSRDYVLRPYSNLGDRTLHFHSLLQGTRVTYVCSVQRVTLASGAYLNQARSGSHILHKGGTLWKWHIWTDQWQYYIWTASLEWDQCTAEGFCQGKTQAHHEGSHTVEEYTCGITRRGIATHGHLAQHKGWPWAYTGVLDLASGAPPHLTAEGAGGTSTGFARIRSIEGNGTLSVIDNEQVPVLLAIWGKYTGGHGFYMEIKKSHKRVRYRPAGSSTNVCYWGAPHQCPRGSNASHRVCSHTKGAR